MATPIRPGNDTREPVQPAGTAGDGMDPYPTYRDPGTSAHHATASKPTDTNLPRSRRTYSLPILIGVVAFLIVVLVAVFAGGYNLFRTSDEGITPGDGATAPIGAEGEAEAGVGLDRPEAPGTFDRDVAVDTETGPGEVEATPGAIDVPGGDVVDTERTAPAQQ